MSWCIQQFIPLNEELDDFLTWFFWEQDTLGWDSVLELQRLNLGTEMVSHTQ
jgi:hypothetical protein